MADERLAQVREAIQKVMLGGQHYKIGSRTVTRADLQILRQMEKELQAEEAAGTTSRLIDDTYVAFFEGR